MTKKLWLMIVIGLMMASSVKAAEAAKFTLTPATKSSANGSSFDVVVGIESGTEKVYTADVWMTFDATKLQVNTITAVSSPAFPFSLGDKNIDNTAGTIKVALNPAIASSLDAKVASGGLLTINFTAKNTGVAAVAYTCTTGNLNDANILDPNANDIIECAANQSGSYTITASSSDSTSTATPTSSSVSTPTTASTTSTLPQTGVDAPTILLTVVGIIGVAGAWILRFL